MVFSMPKAQKSREGPFMREREHRGRRAARVGARDPNPTGGVPGHRRAASPRGVALIMVVWVMVFVSIVVSAFAFAMRTELSAARNFKEEAEAFALAEAGVAWAAATLANEGATGGGASPALSAFSSGDIPLGRGRYRVSVTAEGGRINLNGAPVEVLRRLLQQTGVSDPRLLDVILDSIQDWRDPDSLARPDGAEEDYYRSLPHPYSPQNGNFEAVEELLLVRGMTREILFGNIGDPARLAALLDAGPEERALRPGEYLGIHDFLAVIGPGQVNLASASRDVLMAAGLSGAQAADIIANRTQGLLRGPLPRGAAGIAFTTTSNLYAIESVGSLPGSSFVYRIAATVAKERVGARPRLRVLAWKQGV